MRRLPRVASCHRLHRKVSKHGGRSAVERRALHNTVCGKFPQLRVPSTGTEEEAGDEMKKNTRERWASKYGRVGPSDDDGVGDGILKGWEP